MGIRNSTFTLLGGTRSDWAQPLGEYSDFVDSSDLLLRKLYAGKCNGGYAMPDPIHPRNDL
jgi:hypothetical protein